MSGRVAICVDPARVAAIWPHAAPLIARAMRRGALGRFADVERAVLAGHALLWVVWNGAVVGALVTELAATDDGKVCVLVACGGAGPSPLRPQRLDARVEAFRSSPRRPRPNALT